MDGGAIRKGPWMAEEDEILMEFVRNYGPRDWSSIRSKGLLPRTGKSCRLRWVNKLKPGLKTGCKFSAEEERVVIDLQARFGNKWARIATYLPGRTDNDVKNFWSTRQKRLARILQAQTPPKSHKNHEKLPIFHECPTYQGECSRPSTLGKSEIIRMVRLPDLVNQNLLNLETNCSSHGNNRKRRERKEPPLTFQVPHQQHPLELQLPPENQDLFAGYYDPNFSGTFGWQETPEYANDEELKLHPGFPVRNIPATPDSFFDDFPADMFDYLEQLPLSVGLPDW